MNDTDTSKKGKSETTEKGYYSMLEAVENLVAKEGKNLKEAVLIAEEKLSEWGELGREEVNTISDEVKRDLGSLGETIEEAMDNIREVIELCLEEEKNDYKKINRFIGFREMQVK